MSQKKRCVVISILFLILIAVLSLISFAQQNNTSIGIILRDINSNKNLDTAIVQITSDRTTTYFLQEGEILRISPTYKTKTIEIKIDVQDTKGKDYYTKTSLAQTEEPEQILVYPVGTLRGTVKDKLDNLVGNAKLKFICSGPDIIQYPDTTDSFGTFSIDYFPSGTCKIFATYNKAAGFAEIKIDKGSLEDIEIKLDKTIVSDNGSNWEIILIIIAVILGLILTLVKFLSRKKDSSSIEKQTSSQNKISLTKRSIDITSTLKDKEKQIIRFLAESGGKSTQSKIYYTLGIPKVSLSRYIRRLEQKNIISVNKVSKVNHLQLTEWFVSDEKI